jgi:DNA replication initiation complex subunit (GINS family)
MNDDITYDYLWQAYQKEKQTNQLLLIPKTFYEDTIGFINTIKGDKNHDQVTVENTIRMVNDFFEKRKQKILIYVAYNKQLPQPISNNETEFYNKILQAVKSEKLDFVSTKNSSYVLKSMKDIPEIILPSGSKVGPLQKDQVIETANEQDRNYLVDNTICEQT